jgi:hypothetical protein
MAGQSLMASNLQNFLKMRFFGQKIRDAQPEPASQPKRRWPARTPKPVGLSQAPLYAKRLGVRNASSALIQKKARSQN